MPSMEARVPTDRASRYLVQLCRHAEQMSRWRHGPPAGHGGGREAVAVREVQWSEASGVVRFEEGEWTLCASGDALLLRVDAVDQQALERLQRGIAVRVATVGRRDRLSVSWEPADTWSAPSHQPAPPSEARAGTDRRRRARLGAVGVLAVGGMTAAWVGRSRGRRL